MKKKISREHVPDRLIFVDRFYEKGPAVFLYGRDRDKFEVFRSFFQASQNGGDHIYAYLKKYEKNKLENYFKDYPSLRYIHLDKSNPEELKKEINNINSKNIRLILDFDGQYDLENFIDIFILLGKIPKNNAVLFSHDIDHLDQEKLGVLKDISERIIISTNNGSVIFSSLHKREGSSPSFSTISKTNAEYYVKRSFDVLILSILYKKSMCGLDIIKAFVSNFGILPNQGVVYPFLYSLEKKGLAKSRIEPDNKTKVYSLTESGRDFVKDRIKEYRIIQERILDFVSQSL